ncbi:CatB-related O-acetyltransferase [Staphylococcus carnosus]|uniref:CatB-related O-acetyltransferase n=1 Tax=Staphylococcus carnosus TaxID=1281 RepID=UPI0006ABD5CE|nr:CatB-related O-acetyltransferase [Staphylococcus carnosus]
MRLLIKIFHRIIRIIIFKKGIYGEIGIHNKFSKPVFVSELTSLGSYNYIGPYSMLNNSVIGNFCSIGPSVKIGQAEHSKKFWTTSQLISKELINHSLQTKKTVIGSDVWLAANVVVLQGVRIGNGAIVGANAVVNKDVPPYGIVVGVPAMLIGYRFDENTIERLENTNWYNQKLKTAKKILKNFSEYRDALI